MIFDLLMFAFLFVFVNSVVYVLFGALFAWVLSNYLLICCVCLFLFCDWFGFCWAARVLLVFIGMFAFGFSCLDLLVMLL